MREGWEIRKVKEICDKASSNIAQKEIAGLSGDYPVYGASGYVQNVDFFHRDKPYIGIVKDGSGVGRVNTYPAKTSLLGTLQYIIPKEGYLLGYVAYLLKSLNLAKFATGAAIPHIYFKEYGECKVPIPPVQEQEKIVAELDCLSEVIAKKKQQLEELGKLGQSVFYDMFGDPITNERDWMVRPLIDVVHKDCPVSYGIVQPMDDVVDGIPIVRPIDLIGTVVKPDNLKRTQAEISNAYKRTILRGDEILFCVRGTTGVVALADKSLRGCNTTRGITPLFFDERNERWFIYALFKTPGFRNIVEEYTYGSALKQINLKDLKQLPIIQPPVSLQVNYSIKIKAIEKHKELVKQSIAETETLFNSRMDYWFN